VFCAGILSCREKTLNEQLTAAFSNHLNRLDPDASLDSVHIIWSVPVNEKLARVIDDTVYVREYNRIKRQLAKARMMNKKAIRDSTMLYLDSVYVLRYTQFMDSSMARAMRAGR
jgi:hypothetical protein